MEENRTPAQPAPGQAGRRRLLAVQLVNLAVSMARLVIQLMDHVRGGCF
jgi:hypothetical protein